jgi:predicted DNA-binding transcriptional regulator AlpA
MYLLTKKQTSSVTGAHPVTLMRWAREGRFPQPIRLGPTDRHPIRFVAEEVNAWVEERMSERDGISSQNKETV